VVAGGWVFSPSATLAGAGGCFGNERAYLPLGFHKVIKVKPQHNTYLDPSSIESIFTTFTTRQTALIFSR
jgi:hypothetical protein